MSYREASDSIQDLFDRVERLENGVAKSARLRFLTRALCQITLMASIVLLGYYSSVGIASGGQNRPFDWVFFGKFHPVCLTVWIAIVAAVRAVMYLAVDGGW